MRVMNGPASGSARTSALPLISEGAEQDHYFGHVPTYCEIFSQPSARGYALAPRLALSVLSPEQAGQGSGIVNACTFLGGSVGVAGGAIASALGGFVAVLAMIALAGIGGAVVSRGISETA